MPPTVLVVEDEGLVRLELIALVDAAGLELAGATGSAAEALRLGDERRPDVAVLDINLAGHWEGLDIARHLQAHFGTRIILVSGFGGVELSRRIDDLRPHAVIHKPFSGAELVREMRRAAAVP
ncbi:MAG TPA: response regulator [Alphaproteobacteria bacterium]